MLVGLGPRFISYLSRERYSGAVVLSQDLQPSSHQLASQHSSPPANVSGLPASEGATPATPIDYLTTAKDLAIPAAAIIIALSIALTVICVLIGRIDLEFGFGEKWRFAARRQPDKAPSPVAGELMSEELGPEELQVTLEEKNSVQTAQDPEITEEKNSAFEFMAAKTLAEAAQKFAAFKTTIEPVDEFWETIYVNRCSELGSISAKTDMKRLADDNPVWAMPYAYLIKWASDTHDIENAESYVSLGLQRLASPHFDWILNAAVRYYYNFVSPDRALSFCMDWSQASIPDSIKGELFQVFSDLLKADGKEDGRRMAMEIGLMFRPDQRSKEFNLAYSYSNEPSRWSLGTYHYAEIVGSDYESAMAKNNLGVQYRDLDRDASYDLYDKSAREGNALAASNLANALVSDGYLSIAERLLDDIKDPGSHLENVSSSRAALLAARRGSDLKRKEIEEFIIRQYKVYKKEIIRSYRYRNIHSVRTRGELASDDGSSILSVGATAVICKITIDDMTYQSELRDDVLCYGGKLLQQDVSIISAASIDVSVYGVDGGSFVLLRWPKLVDLNTEVTAVLLNQVPPVAALPTPDDPAR